jgi:hypothetical protein
MKIHPIGSAVAIGNVPNGECFAWRPSDETYVGIKLTNGREVAILWPHLPDNIAVICGVYSVPLGEQPIWLLPEAVVKPTATAEEMRSSSNNEVLTGWLALGHDFLSVTISVGERLGWVNLKTGDLDYDTPKPAIWFSKWSILVPGLDGKHEEFCAIPHRAAR